MAAITAAAVGAAGTAYAANKAAKASRGGGSTSTQEMPAWQRNQFMAAYDATNRAANRTTEQAVAGFNPNQQSAFAQVQANQGLGYADMDAAIAAQKGLNAGGTYSDVDLAKYQNPYTSDVINASLADLDIYRGRNNAQIAAQAEAAGAWGGDRGVLAQSLNNESVDRAAASTIAGLRSQGFNTSAQLAQNDASMRNNFNLSNLGLQMNGNAQLQSMIESRRAAANGDASNLLAIGNQQQGQTQAQMDWEIQRAKLMGDVASQSQGGGTSSTQYYGAAPDRWASTIQGLNTGLQFGKDIYGMFNTGGTKYGSSYYNNMDANLRAGMQNQTFDYSNIRMPGG